MLRGFLVAFLLFSSALQGEEPSWKKHKLAVLAKQRRIPGWCSVEKAEKLMDLIYEIRPSLCVEVGVFGGSSIYPSASALKFVDHGIIYAVDPWSQEAALSGHLPGETDYEWWLQIDLEEIYQSFLSMLNRSQIASFCKVMRKTSKEAASFFADDSIDILHIDGNHAEELALADIELYLPKVKTGGYIWFDDVDRSTTRKAVDYLLQFCLQDTGRSVSDGSCLLFKKIL